MDPLTAMETQAIEPNGEFLSNPPNEITIHASSSSMYEQPSTSIQIKQEPFIDSLVTPLEFAGRPETISIMKTNQNQYDFTITDARGQDDEKINNALAEFLFGCDISVNVIESNIFKRFVSELRPLYGENLPNQEALMSNLLDETYQRSIQRARFPQHSVLLLNYLENDRDSKYKRCLATVHGCKEEQGFVDIFDLDGPEKGSERNLVNTNLLECIDLAEKRFSTSVYALVSKSIESPQSLAPLPDLWVSVCNSSAAENLAEDIFSDASWINCCTKVNKVLGLLNLSNLDEKQTDGVQSKFHEEPEKRTRKYPLVRFLEKLTEIHDALKDSPEYSEVIQPVLHDTFVEKCRRYVEVFDSLVSHVKSLEDPDCHLADSVKLWNNVLNNQNFNEFAPLVQNRRDSALSVYALTAYYFHPTHDNNKLTTNEMDTVNNFLIDKLDAEGMTEWYLFRNGTGIFRILTDKKVVDATVFWKTAELKCPTLSKIANMLISIPASSSYPLHVLSRNRYLKRSMDDDITVDQQKKILSIYYSLNITN